MLKFRAQKQIHLPTNTQYWFRQNRSNWACVKSSQWTQYVWTYITQRYVWTYVTQRRQWKLQRQASFGWIIPTLTLGNHLVTRFSPKYKSESHGNIFWSDFLLASQVLARIWITLLLCVYQLFSDVPPGARSFGQLLDNLAFFLQAFDLITKSAG